MGIENRNSSAPQELSGSSATVLEIAQQVINQHSEITTISFGACESQREPCRVSRDWFKEVSQEKINRIGSEVFMFSPIRTEQGVKHLPIVKLISADKKILNTIEKRINPNLEMTGTVLEVDVNNGDKEYYLFGNKFLEEEEFENFVKMAAESPKCNGDAICTKEYMEQVLKKGMTRIPISYPSRVVFKK